MRVNIKQIEIIMSKAVLISEVTVTDPDTGGEVQVSIFKDKTSGGIFGVDSSFIEQTFEDEEEVIVNSPFAVNKLVELEGV